MGTKAVKEPATSSESDAIAKLRSQYGSGPIEFAGTENALYERHLVFDNVVDPAAAGPRERFEAIARSVRDILSQRWIKTENTYARENPKRVYYLSMEFLIGRSLANNVTNLLLDPYCEASRERETSRLARACSIRNPTPAWAMVDSGGWRLASSTPWRRCNSRLWGTACGTNTACSSRLSAMAGSRNSPTTGSAVRTPGRSRARTRRLKSSSIARLRCEAGPCRRSLASRPA